MKAATLCTVAVRLWMGSDTRSEYKKRKLRGRDIIQDTKAPILRIQLVISKIIAFTYDVEILLDLQASDRH